MKPEPQRAAKAVDNSDFSTSHGQLSMHDRDTSQWPRGFRGKALLTIAAINQSQKATKQNAQPSPLPRQVVLLADLRRFRFLRLCCRVLGLAFCGRTFRFCLGLGLGFGLWTCVLLTLLSSVLALFGNFRGHGRGICTIVRASFRLHE